MDGSGTSDIYVDGHAMVALWSGFLDPTDGVMWDISPAASGNRDSYPNTLETYASLYDAANGGSPSPGHSVNPATGAGLCAQHGASWGLRTCVGRVLGGRSRF